MGTNRGAFERHVFLTCLCAWQTFEVKQTITFEQLKDEARRIVANSKRGMAKNYAGRPRSWLLGIEEHRQRRPGTLAKRAGGVLLLMRMVLLEPQSKGSPF